MHNMAVRKTRKITIVHAEHKELKEDIGTNLAILRIGGNNMDNNQLKSSMLVSGGAVYKEPQLMFKDEGIRLAKYSKYDGMYFSSVKLARYGFIPIGNHIVKCVFGAETKRLKPRRYNSNEILAIHSPDCPVITRVNYDNVELRTREAEDSDSNRAIAYLVNIRAPAIHAINEGVPNLDPAMVQAFVEFYSAEAVSSEIKDHFERNGLFPNRNMLFRRLEI